MVDNQVVSRIAKKIRNARLEKNLTIQELASRTHVSKGLLSKIENSRTVPSLPVFVTLIQSLELSLKEFFQDMVLINGQDYLLVKRDQYLAARSNGVTGVISQMILSQNISNSTMQVTLLSIEANVSESVSSFTGFKFHFVVAGSCAYSINNTMIQLEEGDALYFDATIPHMAVNNSDTKVTLLSIHFTATE